LNWIARSNGTGIAEFDVSAAEPESAQGARDRLAASQNALFVKRIALIRIGAFLLVATCGALCQSASRPGDRLQLSPLEGASAQAQLNALPDAPSQVALGQPDRLKTIVNEARVPLATGAAGINADVLRATEATHLTPEAPLTVTALSKGIARQEKANDFFSQYLNASRQSSRYEPSSSGKVMARATDAASRIFVTRAPSGKPRVNTQYFLQVLTSVAAESASRRYRARSGTAPLSAFGSTVGNDAGMNLLHEFGPGIRQKVTGHLPEFVSRIGEHISRAQSRR
jgi:hypothetical protein